MHKLIDEFKNISNKTLLIKIGVGVAINAALLLLTFAMLSASAALTMATWISVIALVGSLIAAIVSIAAAIKVRWQLKIVPVLYLVISLAVAAGAQFNIWWVGF